MFTQRFTADFNVMDKKTMTAGMIINIEAVSNEPWVTGKGPIRPSIISSTWPGLNNESMSAYMYNNIMDAHNAESFILTSSKIPGDFMFVSIFLLFECHS